jgi:hypothetical protein
MALIVDADAEQLLIDYLYGALPALGFPVPVASRIERLGSDPSKRPAESVVLVRTGGPRRDFVTDQPQITVDSRARLESRAVQLANACRALLNDLPGQVLAGHPVYSVQEFSGPTNQPTDQDPVRYSQSFSIALRSAA